MVFSRSRQIPRVIKRSSAPWLLGAAVIVVVGMIGAAFILAHSQATQRERIRANIPVTKSVTSTQSARLVTPTDAKVTYSFDSRLDTSIGAIYLLGWVHNESGVRIGKPKVRAVLRDAQQRDIASFVGYAHPDEVLPGERVPVMVLIQKPPSYQDVEYLATAQTLTVPSTTLRDFLVEPLEPRPASFGSRWQFEGKVTNRTSSPAQFVQVEVQALDGEGKLVGLARTFVDDRRLAPRAVSRFQTDVSVARAFSRANYVVWGRQG